MYEKDKCAVKRCTTDSDSALIGVNLGTTAMFWLCPEHFKIFTDTYKRAETKGGKEMNYEDVKLGEKVRHTITGFTGVVIGKIEYLSGCERVIIQDEKLDKDGKPQEWMYFDVGQIERVGDEAEAEITPRARKGGPMPDPPCW